MTTRTPLAGAALDAALAVALAPSAAPAEPPHPTDIGARGLAVQGTVATASTFVGVPPGYAVRRSSTSRSGSSRWLIRIACAPSAA